MTYDNVFGALDTWSGLVYGSDYSDSQNEGYDERLIGALEHYRKEELEVKNVLDGSSIAYFRGGEFFFRDWFVSAIEIKDAGGALKVLLEYHLKPTGRMILANLHMRNVESRSCTSP